MREHNPHFNFELSSPACKTTFNAGSKLHITVLKIQGILEKLITPDDLNGNAKRVISNTVAFLQVRIIVHQCLPHCTKYKTVFPLIHYLRSWGHFIIVHKIKHVLSRHFPEN